MRRLLGALVFLAACGGVDPVPDDFVGVDSRRYDQYPLPQIDEPPPPPIYSQPPPVENPPPWVPPPSSPFDDLIEPPLPEPPPCHVCEDGSTNLP